MVIKDLEMSKDLDRDALSIVRGGRNSIEQGGVCAPVNASSAVLNDNDLHLKLANKTANVLGSLGTEI